MCGKSILLEFLLVFTMILQKNMKGFIKENKDVTHDEIENIEN